MADPLVSSSLDALLARAEDLALFSMRVRGSVAPALLAVSAGGPICFIPSSLKDERAKDKFANIARLVGVTQAATVAVMMVEAWIKTAWSDGTLDRTVPPSESLHRREVVVLTGESHTGCRQKILPIIRTGAGGFFGFGEFTAPPETTISGRFAQILSPQVPTTTEQAKASALLAVWGVRAEGWRDCGVSAGRTTVSFFRGRSGCRRSRPVSKTARWRRWRGCGRVPWRRR
jgi:hypothetical protein